MAIFSIMLLSSAYMNVTYLNTTIILNNDTSAHVIEIVSLSISNSSIQQYNHDRDAINLTISDWQKALDTNILVEHILNPVSSVSKFTFLPGPIMYNGNGDIANLEMNYYVSNITTANQIAPRKIEYQFDNKVFNFIHAASGQALPENARLNIILPQGAEIVSLYPLPDYPQLSFIGNYSGTHYLSWYSGEPLAKFSLSYILTQSMQEEVAGFFNNIIFNYTAYIYLALIIIVIIGIAYLLVKQPYSDRG